MSKLVERCCKWCEKAFIARDADVKRGWAKFCSKACKAKEQEARTGQYSALLRSGSGIHPGPIHVVAGRRNVGKSRLYPEGMNKFEREQMDYERAMDETEWGWDGHKNVW
jgi:hypothetical protein